MTADEQQPATDLTSAAAVTHNSLQHSIAYNQSCQNFPEILYSQFTIIPEITQTGQQCLRVFMHVQR